MLPGGGYFRCCVHFPDAETEAQGRRELCPQLHRLDVVALGLGPGLSGVVLLFAVLPTLFQLGLREPSLDSPGQTGSVTYKL